MYSLICLRREKIWWERTAHPWDAIAQPNRFESQRHKANPSCQSFLTNDRNGDEWSCCSSGMSPSLTSLWGMTELTSTLTLRSGWIGRLGWVTIVVQRKPTFILIYSPRELFPESITQVWTIMPQRHTFLLCRSKYPLDETICGWAWCVLR